MPEVVERVATPRGELVLRHDGEHYEVISNGTFLMDTRNGESERVLVTEALRRHPTARSVLIGGLGVGFSLREAVAAHQLQRIVVVEISRELVGWHATYLAPYSAGALDDPRVEVVVTDLADHLSEPGSAYDVICLDTDNGPDWTVNPANAVLYSDAGNELLASRLTPGGVLAVWSAARSAAYEQALARHFDALQTRQIPVVRGNPDVVMSAVRRPRLAEDD